MPREPCGTAFEFVAPFALCILSLEHLAFFLKFSCKFVDMKTKKVSLFRGIECICEVRCPL
jgi:hypothetical protein